MVTGISQQELFCMGNVMTELDPATHCPAHFMEERA